MNELSRFDVVRLWLILSGLVVLTFDSWLTSLLMVSTMIYWLVKVDRLDRDST